MLGRLRFLIPLLLVGALVLPAIAAEQVAHLPRVKGFSSGRIDSVLTVNGQILAVARGELASPTRFHAVVKTYPMSGIPEVGNVPETTYEVIVYDDALYYREGDDTQWYVEEGGGGVNASADAIPDAVAGLEELGPITRLDAVPIADTTADHYQIWIGPPDDVDVPANDSLNHIAIDLWIGQQVSYLYRFGVSIVGTDPQLGPLQGVFLSQLSDFDDTSIVVGPPENAIPEQVAHSSLLTALRMRGPLAAITSPLALPGLLHGGQH